MCNQSISIWRQVCGSSNKVAKKEVMVNDGETILELCSSSSSSDQTFVVLPLNRATFCVCHSLCSTRDA